jgi:hypothetical protein
MLKNIGYTQVTHSCGQGWREGGLAGTMAPPQISLKKKFKRWEIK